MSLREYANGVRYEMIDGGRGMRVYKDTTKGELVSTLHWHEPADAELIAKSLATLAAGDGEGREIGETLRMKRLGPVGVTLDTGPPTWWWPHLSIKFGRHWELQAGWLRVAVEIWKYEEKE